MTFIDPMWETMGPPGPPGVDGIDGRDGRDGSDGADGADGADGQSLTPRGKWNPTIIYEPGDLVSYQGATYIARVPSRGRRPFNKSAWQLLAERGADGKDGPAGPRGRSAAAVASEASEVEYSGGPFANGLALRVTAGGSAALALADDPTTATVVGIASGGQKMRSDGQITLSGLTPGATYYLSPTIAGALTSTPPATVGQVVVSVGRALSTTVLDIEIAEPILL